MIKLMKTQIGTVIFLFVVISFGGCYSNFTPPLYEFETVFNKNQISDTENIIDFISLKYHLSVTRKNRDGMSYLSDDEPAFYTFILFEESPIITVSNVGVPKLLRITVYPHTDMDEILLRSIAIDLVKSIENKLRVINFTEKKFDSEGNTNNEYQGVRLD